MSHELPAIPPLTAAAPPSGEIPVAMAETSSLGSRFGLGVCVSNVGDGQRETTEGTEARRNPGRKRADRECWVTLSGNR